MEHTEKDLLRKYIDAECGNIFEYSGSFKSSLLDLVEDAKKMAEDLGIEWSDDLLDDYCWDIINDYKPKED